MCRLLLFPWSCRFCKYTHFYLYFEKYYQLFLLNIIHQLSDIQIFISYCNKSVSYTHLTLPTIA